MLLNALDLSEGDLEHNKGSIMVLLQELAVAEEPTSNTIFVYDYARLVGVLGILRICSRVDDDTGSSPYAV